MGRCVVWAQFSVLFNVYNLGILCNVSCAISIIEL